MNEDESLYQLKRLRQSVDCAISLIEANQTRPLSAAERESYGHLGFDWMLGDFGVTMLRDDRRAKP